MHCVLLDVWKPFLFIKNDKCAVITCMHTHTHTYTHALLLAVLFTEWCIFTFSLCYNFILTTSKQTLLKKKRTLHNKTKQYNIPFFLIKLSFSSIEIRHQKYKNNYYFNNLFLIYFKIIFCSLFPVTFSYFLYTRTRVGYWYHQKEITKARQKLGNEGHSKTDVIEFQSK